MSRKVYVDVIAVFHREGGVTPRLIRWEDGRQFKIDEVLDRRPAPALRVGGWGIRYTVRIGRTKSYLFLDEYRWFVETRQ